MLISREPWVIFCLWLPDGASVGQGEETLPFPYFPTKWSVFVTSRVTDGHYLTAGA